MFSGIITAIGQIHAMEERGGDKRITIDAGDLDLADVNIGDSIAINGVCLTVVAKSETTFSTDISAATLACTTLKSVRQGMPVNLEKALRVSDRLHGHLVAGHVDGVGSVREISTDVRSMRLILDCPQELLRYIAVKGSVAVDGVSLTVNNKTSAGFIVNIIPHTLAQTIMGNYRDKTPVNIEVDIIARHIESLMSRES